MRLSPSRSETEVLYRRHKASNQKRVEQPVMTDDGENPQAKAVLDAEDDLADMIDRVVESNTRWDPMVDANIRAECARIDAMIERLPPPFRDRFASSAPWRDLKLRGKGRW
jgi:hypothetical protein